jgi:hypothetical protein
VPCRAFRGPLALHLRLLAIVIIPNSSGMFNENRTFFRKNLVKTSESVDYAGSLYIDGIYIIGYYVSGTKMRF